MDDVFQALLEHFGPQHWPAEGPFEVAVASILARNAGWQNVTKALENLRRNDLLDPHSLSELSTDELAELIRPAGRYRQKAAQVKGFLRLLMESYGGSLDSMWAAEAGTLRAQLLAINGIGPEAADSILLYAASKPSFVVDCATHRIAARHGWVGTEAGYEELKDYFDSRLPDDASRMGELHALLVQVGKRYCRPREALCGDCPLRPFLPEGGPIEPE